MKLVLDRPATPQEVAAIAIAFESLRAAEHASQPAASRWRIAARRFNGELEVRGRRAARRRSF